MGASIFAAGFKLFRINIIGFAEASDKG